MVTLTLIKTFFSHIVGIITLCIVIALGTVAGIEYLSAKHTTTELDAANTKIGDLSTAVADKTEAASECSAGVAATVAANAQASSEAQVAVEETAVKASMYNDHAAKILAQKPVGTDDYTNSKALMNDLIANRQAQLEATK
jgi:sensor c-di-GMP phosphodiesterase-like protein